MFGFKKKETIINSPVDGIVVDVKTLKDEVFSNNLMGTGIAVRPTNKDFFSPLDGKLATVFATGHAYGIENHKTGNKVLLHIGIDTVELEGKGFKAMVTQGSETTVGQKLCEVDLEVLKKHKKESAAILIFLSESEDYESKKVDFLVPFGSEIKAGQPLIKISKK